MIETTNDNRFRFQRTQLGMDMLEPFFLGRWSWRILGSNQSTKHGRYFKDIVGVFWDMLDIFGNILWDRRIQNQRYGYRTNRMACMGDGWRWVLSKNGLYSPTHRVFCGENDEPSTYSSTYSYVVSPFTSFWSKVDGFVGFTLCLFNIAMENPL